MRIMSGIRINLCLNDFVDFVAIPTEENRMLALLVMKNFMYISTGGINNKRNAIGDSKCMII